MNRLKPMSLNEAIEVMKILRPHVKNLATAPDGLNMIRRLLLAFKVENTEENVGRIVALTQKKSFEEIAAKYATDPSPETVFSDLILAFQANPIPDLLDAAYILGISETPWSSLNA